MTLGRGRDESDDSAVYDVFISYSRRDKLFARKLQKALGSYKPPEDLSVPQRSPRIFRDETDFTGVDYQKSVEKHLTDSARLIVVCSPHARKSEFVDDEIRKFAAVRGVERVLPILLSGIPNNEASPGQEDEMAFPRALCDLMGMPLATSYLGFDPARDKLKNRAFDDAWFTLLANLYDRSRGEIEGRERKRRVRKQRTTTAVVGTIFALLVSALVITILSRQEAVRQQLLAEEREQAALARQLGVQAQAVLAGRGQAAFGAGHRAKLAVQLAVESLLRYPTLEGDQALRESLALLPRPLSDIRIDLSSSILSADGRYLLGLSRDRQPVLLDARSGRELARLALEGAGSLAFSGDARHFAVGLAEGVAVYRNLGASDPEPAGLLIFDEEDSGASRPAALALGPEGRILVAARGEFLEIWEVATASRLTTIAARGHRVTISPDGRYLAAVVLELRHLHKAGRFTVWKGWSTGAPREVLADTGWRVVFAPDGSHLLASDSEGGVAVWRIDSSSPRGNIPVPDVADMTMFGVPVYDQLAISGDGRYVATYRSDTVFVWEDWRKGPRLAARVSGLSLKAGDAIALGPTGRNLVTLGGSVMGEVHLDVWEALGALEVSLIDGGETEFKELRFSPDGGWLVTLADDGIGRVWEVASGESIGRSLEAVTALALSPDGRYLALAVGECVRLWEGWPTSDPQATDCLTADGGGQIENLEFGSGGDYLAAVTREPQALHIWEVASRSEVRRTEGVFSMALSSGADVIAVRTDDGLEVGDLLGPGRRFAEQSLGRESLSPDGRLLAHKPLLGSVVETHELATDQPPASFIHDNERVGQFRFAPDGRYLATVSNPFQGPGSVHVWDLVSGREVARVGHGREMTIASFSPNGRYLATASDDGTARIWLWRAGDLAAAACARLDESLPKAVWNRYLGDTPYRESCAAESAP